jgi:ABC-type multidrug transport system ATPase subunit
MSKQSTTLVPDREATNDGSLLEPRCALAPHPLEAKGLTFRRGRQTVLRGINLVAAPGEIVAVIGGNGVGKSTLVQCLAAALRATSGAVFWFGDAAGGTPATRRLVGFLGHESGLYPALTPWENLLFAANMCGLDSAADRAAEWLCAAGLKGQSLQSGCLSRGMRQRLAIVRAVIHEPPIVILDEPFANLDPPGRCWLAEFLRGLRDQGRAILVTSHDAEQSRLPTDHVICLVAGRLRSVGQPESGRWRA